MSEYLAKVVPDAVPVFYSKCDNMEYLTFSVPNGWDDIKPMVNKVLRFEGKDFTFSGWNSDKNLCYFRRPLFGTRNIAKIIG